MSAPEHTTAPDELVPPAPPWPPPAPTPSHPPGRAAGRGPSGGAGTAPVGRAGRGPATGPRALSGRQLAGADDTLRGLVVGFAQAFLEVEAGRRSRRQLRAVMSADLAARLAPRWVRHGRPPGRVVRVHGERTTPNRYDAVVVVARGSHYGALALSLARGRDRWCVVEAVRPEDAGSACPPHRPATRR